MATRSLWDTLFPEDLGCLLRHGSRLDELRVGRCALLGDRVARHGSADGGRVTSHDHACRFGRKHLWAGQLICRADQSSYHGADDQQGKIAPQNADYVNDCHGD